MPRSHREPSRSSPSRRIPRLPATTKSRILNRDEPGPFSGTFVADGGSSGARLARRSLFVAVVLQLQPRVAPKSHRTTGGPREWVAREDGQASQSQRRHHLLSATPHASGSEHLPEDLPLEIIFEDDAFVIINKAAGMIVHPGKGNYSGTLAGATVISFRPPERHCGELETRDCAPIGSRHELVDCRRQGQSGAPSFEPPVRTSRSLQENIRQSFKVKSSETATLSKRGCA